MVGEYALITAAVASLALGAFGAYVTRPQSYLAGEPVARVEIRDSALAQIFQAKMAPSEAAWMAVWEQFPDEDPYIHDLAREGLVRQRIAAYRTMAAAEGGVAGAGGFLLAAADFPVLIGLKIKLLFEIAALYGHDGESWDERLYILSIFRLAFSSAEHRREVYLSMTDWDDRGAERPSTMADFDWRRFQQQYRDYIDLAKLAQLLPVVGAGVGVVVNYRLIDKLGKTATNAYRMRRFAGPAERSRTRPG